MFVYTFLFFVLESYLSNEIRVLKKLLKEQDVVLLDSETNCKTQYLSDLKPK